MGLDLNNVCIVMVHDRVSQSDMTAYLPVAVKKKGKESVGFEDITYAWPNRLHRRKVDVCVLRYAAAAAEEEGRKGGKRQSGKLQVKRRKSGQGY